MIDRHCCIGRIAVTRPLPDIPGYTFLERVELVEDYDLPPDQRVIGAVWHIYRHHDKQVGRYA